MSAASGPVEPERNFLFARTPKIPVGARPRRCADNMNAAVAWSHRLCPFASCSLALPLPLPLARTATRLSPCHGDGCPARTDRARRHSSPISSSLDIACRATIDQGQPRIRGRSSRRRRGPWRRRRVADLRVANDSPRQFRRRTRQSRGNDAAVASPDRTRGRNLSDRAVSRSRRRCCRCPRRAPWAHPRSLSLSRSRPTHTPQSARSHFPLRCRTRASPYPPARLLVPTPPVALFVVKLFMLYILKGTYQPPFP